MIQNYRSLTTFAEHDNCKPHRTDDDYLQKFLRARYWDVESSFELMVNYCKFREQNKTYYEKVRPLQLKSLGDEDIITVTPYRDQKGHRILIYRFGAWKPGKISVDDIFRATIILLELGSLEPIAQVIGGIGIFDLKDLSLSHVFHLSPSVVQKMIALLVTSMPVRTSALHIVNQNWAFNAAYNMFKPFMNAAMKERLFIHGSDMKSLHKHISPNHLPKRYGGVHDDYPYQLWMDNLIDNQRIHKELGQLGYIF
ncbi:alpha-tocopherol transfer protein isoform X2 [Anastrepha obliqua]|uniref:alpha-tocopherol transfer protein isoform X2 n=1 Tax=Anastrepha ludens TaxID=28586 RepID=UPI0023AF7CEE|nr:alpha-tocopherol transfer protein isoform X2 [Anastrepha ludens]XP_054744090.1 alpha-tocopherol transfer protein isoform X2 [Anastrepha obliqua]